MSRLFALLLLASIIDACDRGRLRAADAMEVKTLKVNGGEPAYVEDGTGDTVVFVLRQAR